MKKLGIGTIIGLVVAAVVSVFVIVGSFRPPVTESVQHGWRGTGMDLIYHRAQIASAEATNKVPAVIPAPTQLSGTKASTVYKNLKVLGDVDVSEFGRIMASMSTWVAPTQSCAYCHGAGGNFASDDLYTKRVARRMLQMTRHINTDWQNHVGKTGVVCYTCHRGQPVPGYVWFNSKEPAQGFGTISTAGADAALPANPYQPFLEKDNDIRVVTQTALPSGNKPSIQQAEYTYSLMMAMTQALGVNCTFCHNTRSFTSWDQSSPQRATAWYGIRLARDINTNFMASLHDTFPANRLGPEGDVAKVNCMTCHQGAYKPLLGAKIAEKFPELVTTADAASVEKPAEPAPAPAANPPAPAPATPPAATPAPANPPAAPQ